VIYRLSNVLYIENRDIHQDNGELLDVVNKIHGPSGSACQSIKPENSPAKEEQPAKEDSPKKEEPISEEEDDEYSDLDEWFPDENPAQSLRPTSQSFISSGKFSS